MMRKKKSLIVLALVIFIVLPCVLLFDNMSPPENLGTVRLNVETYLAGKNQPTHPSVVAFPKAWNGAKYWLAYSPYPYGNGEEENPCIAVSNDLLYWESPMGLANPIADNEETGCDELKDPHLLYREDLDRLEMWYLGRLSKKMGGDGETLLLMRKYSYDGINWSKYEIMSATEYLSPSIIWDGNKYQMWGIGYDLWNTKGTIAYQESIDGNNWSSPVLCHIGNLTENIDIWHGSVTEYNGKYNYVFIDESDKQEVFFSESSDGIHFSAPRVIIENNGFWDILYRPTLVFEESKISCIYGVVNHANQWYLSMSTGRDIDNLAGINKNYSGQMQYLSDTPINTNSLRYQLKSLYTSIQKYLRLELLVLVVIELGLLGVRRMRRNIVLALFTTTNIIFSVAYILIRLGPSELLALIAAMLAVFGINVCMAAVLQCAAIYMDKRIPR